MADDIHDRDGVERDQSDYEFCRNFVVTTALHLAEFDYDFDHWGDRQKGQERREASDSDNNEAGGEAASP